MLKIRSLVASAIACLAALAVCVAPLKAEEPAGGEKTPPPKAGEKPPASAASDEPAPKAVEDEAAAGPASPGKTPEAAGEKAPAAGKELEPVYVRTPTRTKARAVEISRFITVLDEREYSRSVGNVAIDALGNQIGIWVEHRTGSTGDAVIRGLSGGNILTLIDGCSLSTFWGEGGFAGDDMQGKVDPESIERIEVIRGPGSVQYGSQALGGVINYITRSCPLDFTDGDFKYGVRSKLGYTTGNMGYSIRNEIFGAVKSMRFIFGSSIRELGDMRAGGDVGRQKPTSSSETNFDMKVEFQPRKGHLASFSHQSVYRDPTHRFYRPTQVNRNIRNGSTFVYKIEGTSDFLPEAEIKFYRQDKEDKRWFLGTNPYWGYAKYETYQIEAQATLAFEAAGKHKMTFGAGYHYDFGESPDDEQFTLVKSSWPVGPPGARTDSPLTHWHNFSLFAIEEWEPVEKLKVSASGRMDYFYFETDPYIDHFYPAAYNANPSSFSSLRAAQANDEFNYTDLVFTGGLGLNWELVKGVHAVASATSGFRQWPPKFGLTQHNGIYAPSLEAANIMGYNFEIGAKWNTKKFDGEAVYYYNTWEGFVEWHPGTFNGQDWYDWNDNGTRDADESIFVRSAGGLAYVTGIEMQGTYRFIGDFDSLFGLGEGPWDGLSLTAGFMYNFGEDMTTRRTDNTSISIDDGWEYEPIRHTHPMRGLLTLKWEEPKTKSCWISITGDFVGRFDRIPRSRLRETTTGSDTGYWNDPRDSSSGLVRPYGLPGYAVWSVMSGWKLTDELSLRLGCENVFDRKYRRAHSRADEMGINFIIGVEAKF